MSTRPTPQTGPVAIPELAIPRLSAAGARRPTAVIAPPRAERRRARNSPARRSERAQARRRSRGRSSEPPHDDEQDRAERKRDASGERIRGAHWTSNPNGEYESWSNARPRSTIKRAKSPSPVNGSTSRSDAAAAAAARRAALAFRSASSQRPSGQRKNFTAPASPSASPGRTVESRYRQTIAASRQRTGVRCEIRISPITCGQSAVAPYTRQSRTPTSHKAAPITPDPAGRSPHRRPSAVGRSAG